MSHGICIAVCGKRGAGKDAIADILCAPVHGFVNHKFARPLKSVVRTLFGLEADHVDGPLKDVVHPRWGVTPRMLMQWFGTDVMQHGLARLRGCVPSTGRTFWSDQLRATLEADGPDAKVVVSDLRFRHELDMLREVFAERLVTVRVVRSLPPPQNAATIEALVDKAVGQFGDLHESEWEALDPVDYNVVNDGTLEDLKRSVSDILCDLKA